jgi:RNA polymerase sigma-70 factor (ECF subfamily)
LLQSGSLRALEKSGELQDPAKVYSWLLSVFRNLALDLLRTRKSEASRSQDLEPAEFDNLPAAAPESPANPAEAGVCDCGLKLMKNIPKSYSTLLQRVELDGASIQQMARALATTPNNVSVRLHRARHSLKAAVQKHCEVETLAQCLQCDCGKDD